jgi:hypothetical protein
MKDPFHDFSAFSVEYLRGSWGTPTASVLRKGRTLKQYRRKEGPAHETDARRPERHQFRKPDTDSEVPLERREENARHPVSRST